MRVTYQSQSIGIRNELTSANSRLANVQRQVASGKQVQRASDDPAAALKALRYRRAIRAQGQYDRNLGESKAWLGAADSALQAVDSRLTRAQQLTIQAENGSLSASARTAIATELRSIRDELIGVANTRHLGRPIFAGTSGSDAAYAPDATYQGDSGKIERMVADGSKYQVNVTGPAVFGTTDATDPLNGDIFQALSDIADRVVSNNSPANGLDAINRGRGLVHTAQATMGARLSSLEKIETRNATTVGDLKSALSETEDVDFTKAILDLKAEEASYQAALAVSGRLLSQSLLDFLR